MWEHPATQANLAILVDRGVHVVGPEPGELAEGEVGMGRMAEPGRSRGRVIASALLAAARDAVDGALAPAGKVLVTAGGTREPLDAVRFLGNRSSGRMGVALAAEARRRGARGDAPRGEPHGAGTRRASRSCRRPTAADLRREALDRARRGRRPDGRGRRGLPAGRAHRREAPQGRRALAVELVPTADVAKALGAARTTGQVLVAFGAESGEAGLERKRAMLDGKNVDLVVYNDVGRERHRLRQRPTTRS